MIEPRFVHLRVRSAFSLLEGALTEKSLVDACQKDGMPAVAVTDRVNLFGVMPFCSAAMAAGIQPIVGALIPLMQESKPVKAAGKRQQRPPQLTLLVKDEAGYGNLMKLMSRAYLHSDADADPAIALKDLLEHNEGLIVLTGGANGPIARLVLAGEEEAAKQLTSALKEVFQDRLYVEISRHNEQEELQCEPFLLDLAFAENLPIVATNDVHFIDESMHKAHDALICIAESTQVVVEDRKQFSNDYRFKSQAEMEELFADLPEAIENTLNIAKRCAFAAPARAPILPPFDSADGRNENDELRAQAREGLKQRLQTIQIEDAEPYRTRLEYELDVIVQMQFPGYFLIVSDFIKWAKSHDIPVGPGRGSGAGSVVAWSLEITDLDPLRFGLLFERFLNPERVSMPDFDIDFCMNRRDEVIAYVQQKYGRDKVAAIITFGKLQARAALRDVGRVLGLPFGLVDRISKMVPFNPANPPTLAQALEMEPRLKEAKNEDPAVARMIETALKLEGLPRHASTHAAGIVIGDRPLEELVPLYRDPRSSMPVTQFNMKDVEKAGLVKFDFLGLTTLTMLQLGEKIVNERGTRLDLSGLPLDDDKTYALLSRAETSGVFQLESGGMRDALRQLKPDCFEDIIAMVSLYRPGPMDNIPRYIAVKHGREEAEYFHPLLKPILEETNGVIIYQEQVMEIARQLAGYSLGGADVLRRAMGKKIKAEMDAQREVFVKGALEREIDEDMANTIFDSVAKFASYGFNKSHAAAYALLAYHTAYLKANHPVEFYAAVMTMELANQEKLAAYRQEMEKREIKLFPPDVNASNALFKVEDAEGGPGVRFALGAIKGVGRQAMEVLAKEREQNGPFEDLFDLTARVGHKSLNRRLLEGLIKAGALDGLGSNQALIDGQHRSGLRVVFPALVGAACQQVFQVERAGDGAFRHDLGPHLEDRVHDLLERHQKAGHGHRPLCADHRILRRLDRNHAVETAVQRQVGEEGFHSRHHGREGRAGRGIVHRPDCWVTAPEIIVNLVTLDRHLDVDRDHALARSRVAIDVIDGVPGAVRQGRNTLPHGALDIVLNLVHALGDLVAAILADQAQDFTLRHLGGLGLRMNVANDRGGVTRIVGDQICHIRTEITRPEQAHRRDAHGLAEHVPRGDVEGAGHGAPQIGPVAVGLGEPDQRVFVEDRPDEAHIAEMSAASVGVVDRIDIAGHHLALEGANDILAGEVKCADVNGDIVIPLGNRIAICVVQRVGKIAVVDHEGIAGAQHLLGHLIHRGDERVLQDFERNGVQFLVVGHGVTPERG